MNVPTAIVPIDSIVYLNALLIGLFFNMKKMKKLTFKTYLFLAKYHVLKKME